MNTSTGTTREWGLVIVGVLLVILSALIAFYPGLTLFTVAIMAGMLLLFSGGADLARWMRVHKTMEGSGWLLITVVLDIVLGIMFLVHPVVTAGVIPWVVGIFMIAYGVMAIFGSIGMKRVINSWVFLMVMGILSIIIGIMFIMNPENFALFLAVFLAFRGGSLIVLGFMGQPASIL